MTAFLARARVLNFGHENGWAIGGAAAGGAILIVTDGAASFSAENTRRLTQPNAVGRNAFPRRRFEIEI